MEILLLISLAVVVITGIVASKKDRSVLGWVILSLFFGIFALLILACLSNRNKDRIKLAAAINGAK